MKRNAKEYKITLLVTLPLEIAVLETIVYFYFYLIAMIIDHLTSWRNQPWYQYTGVIF